MRGGKTTLWRGGFFFCRFIGLERRVHHANVLCGLARFFSSGYGKRTEQSAIRLLRMAVRWQWRKRAESSADKGLSFQSRQSPKKKITVEKTGKTIRGCRDKHQGNLFERDGARKVSHVGEAPGDSTGECVPFVPSGFAYTFGHGACQSA
ncbi:hypothetical protein AAH013_19550 [Phocaeicola dorei]|uniref:hypothetical protein n=1 Tax=Phocaeicola dorei TaxID=357276 RepID=UPI0039B5EBB0